MTSLPRFEETNMIVDKKQINSFLSNMESGEAERVVKAIINWSQDVQGSWNGDESGRQEQEAHSASEIEDKARELLELIQDHQNL